MSKLTAIALIVLGTINVFAIHAGFTKANEHRKVLTGAVLFHTERSCNAPNV